MMNEETLSIVHKYISIEWARKTLEHDLTQIQRAELKYPVLFEEAAVKVLDQLSLKMRDLKREMHQRGIKVVATVAYNSRDHGSKNKTQRYGWVVQYNSFFTT